MLPIIRGREDHGTVNNLPIEFYFSDEYLSIVVDGKSIEFEYPEIQVPFKGMELPLTKFEDLQYRMIIDYSKLHFANIVIKEFPDEAFKHFKILFDTIGEALTLCENVRNQA